jgi:hypothetical protein
VSPDEAFYSAQLDNPPDLNLNSYVHKNPLSNVDPDGHKVRICASDSSQCYDLTDDQWNAIKQQIAARDSGGVTVDGKGFMGTGTINCGGSACGTATYFQESLIDESGGQLAGIALGMGIGKAAGAAWDAVARWFGRGAGDVVGNVAVGAAKSTVQEILEGAASEGWSRASIFSKPGGMAQATKDFNALDGTARKAGNVMIKDLPNGGGRAVLRTDPSTWSNGRSSLDIPPTGGGYKSTAIRYNP